MLKSDSYLNLGEVTVNGGAKMKVTLSDSWAAPHLKDNCVDGNPDTFCHSKNPKGWWVAFTLEEPTCIETITVLNRHNGWHDRIVGAGISVINQGTEIFTDTFDSTKKSYEWNLRDGGKVDVSAALVTSSKSAMLAAGWSWTGCTTSHHGGDNLDNGIWCHSQEEMHLKIPMSGGPSWCTATFMNGYGNTAANGFVRFMKNGVQLGEARANSQATVSFEYRAGDALELWEGFAIAKVPANWIQCGPQPKWHLVLRQQNGFWFKKGQWSLNADDPNNANFAILDQLESFKRNGKFEFKLRWPKDGLQDQVWTQTSNPVTGAPQGGAQGYQAISAPHSSNRWGGLENGGTYSLLDGTVNHGNWYYSVGSFQKWSSGIPGPASPVNEVELWVHA